MELPHVQTLGLQLFLNNCTNIFILRDQFAYYLITKITVKLQSMLNNK